MSEKLFGRLEKSLAYLSWHYAAGCVLDVFHENQRNEDTPNTFSAMADVWCINDDLRKDIFERAQRFWCKRIAHLRGIDATYFPLSVDAVARLYFRIRKRTKAEIDAFDQEILDAQIESKPPEPSMFDGLT